MKRATVLYLTNLNYPLWLTKNIIMYVCGKNLIDSIDWIKSGRNRLFVKKMNAIPQIKELKFFYPDGELFEAKSEEEMESFTNQNENTDDNTSIEDSTIPEDYWFQE
ncbi:lef-6 [Matsumuraeses phaseoli granulovirus]|uniref:Lef-6 n=1 Tax=Matsumuraeses phaseoli granulovirus TaxID=2760664 RepID=A0AAE7MLH0_9BBAC|nr:lef-6 [Matsumuraeses phaseoli granulovirus]QOD40033.1 lef-6 [Matsumuraeses phaseoli granulovirus]